MLVLTRKLDESVVIAEDIVVTILAIDRDRVKIGIRARREVPVIRMELLKAVKEQTKIAEKLAQEDKTEHLEPIRELLRNQLSENDDDKENDISES